MDGKITFAPPANLPEGYVVEPVPIMNDDPAFDMNAYLGRLVG